MATHARGKTRIKRVYSKRDCTLNAGDIRDAQQVVGFFWRNSRHDVFEERRKLLSVFAETTTDTVSVKRQGAEVIYGLLT
mmetsp:Transcript_10664/g.21481  ORF Transcript_10664/g.21481 Transcript_10664/m.21481 type:complete len:80 (-) Transcript_10664:437-676(-)